MKNKKNDNKLSKKDDNDTLNDYDDEKLPLSFLDILAMMLALMQLMLPFLIAIVAVYFFFILFVTKIWLT